MPNVGKLIAKNNARVLKKLEPPQTIEDTSCNCNNKEACPLPENCRIKGTVYQATVVSPLGTETYVGGTSDPLKHRVANHMSDTRLRHRKGSTFSKHIWKIKDLGHTPTSITWKI